jgi:hypothetical protein
MYLCSAISIGLIGLLTVAVAKYMSGVLSCRNCGVCHLDFLLKHLVYVMYDMNCLASCVF